MNLLRSVAAIAATYAYFLLFAQFSFIEGLLARGGDSSGIKPAMAAMGICGILACFVAPRLVFRFGGRTVMRSSFALAAVVALFTLAPMPGILGGALIGFSLGILTVVLAGTLREVEGLGGLARVVGWGTGVAYALCNVPALFEASWQTQSICSAGFAALGFFATPHFGKRNHFEEISPGKIFPILVLVLLALVWLDSAAFYIIQHTEAFKKSTWGPSLLWRNGALHLAAAVLAGWLLEKGRMKEVLVVALLLLSAASQMVSLPSLAGAAGWLYPVGVSFYSVALVVLPSGAPTARSSLVRAAWLFGIGGWFGSANGIGMAENLHRVPAWFLGLAWLPVVFLLTNFLAKSRALPAKPVLLLLPLLVWVGAGSSGTVASPAVDRGREVYLSEGCIHCHSRYVRPDSSDIVPWGPVGDLEKLMTEKPVLFGNRRQGPDLLQVGVRRSPEWLEVHFKNPRDLVPGSVMPSYAHLFQDDRGKDLIAFLTDVSPDAWQGRNGIIRAWKPEGRAKGNAGTLFERNCAMCHGAGALGDGALAKEFAKAPANLVQGPFPFSGSLDDTRNGMARIVKFGIPGTDMPGHEWLEDGDVLALVDYLLSLRGEGLLESDGKEATR